MSKLFVPMLGLSVSVILIPTYAQTQKIDTQKMQAQFSIPEIVIYADKNKSLTSVLKIDSDKMKKLHQREIILRIIYVPALIYAMKIVIKMVFSKEK